MNLILTGFGLLILFIIWIRSFFTVNPGEVGMIKTLGSLDSTIYSEGIYTKNPFIGSVITINTRAKKLEDTTTASTNDLQSIGINVAFTYQITKDWVKEIFRRFGDDDNVATNLALPSMKETVRSVVANYKADELITKRQEVSSAIQEKLQNKLNEFGLQVTDINIQDIKFSDKFNDAVEAKVKAEQDALAKKNELEKTKYEAEQTIVRSKAEAETIRIQAEAVRAQGGEEYVKLKWIEKWDWKMPTHNLGDGSSMILSK